MTARRAAEDDLGDATAWLSDHAPSGRCLEWVLAPAAGDQHVRQTLMTWLVSNAFDLGVLVIDDTGHPLGGQPKPLDQDAWNKLHRRTAPRAPVIQVGRSLYPKDLPHACNNRLFDLGRVSRRILPRGRMAQLSIGLVPGAPASEELWGMWFDCVGPRPTVAITTQAELRSELEQHQFVVQRERPEGPDGFPALRCWVRP